MKILKPFLLLSVFMMVSAISFAKETAIPLKFNNQFYNLATLTPVGPAIKTNLPMVTAYVIWFHGGMGTVHPPGGGLPPWAEYNIYITVRADNTGPAIQVPVNFWISLTIDTFPSISRPYDTFNFSINAGQIRGNDTMVPSENNPLDASYVRGMSQSVYSYNGISVYPSEEVHPYSI